MNTKIEMPKYKCHKEVWALKIAALQVENRETEGGAWITPVEKGFVPIWVDNAYLRKHDPQIGGYYVVYEDGYESFSPAEAFENGYTKIADNKNLCAMWRDCVLVNGPDCNENCESYIPLP